MDIIRNLYNNTGVSGVVEFINGAKSARDLKPSVKNVAINAGIPATTPVIIPVANHDPVFFESIKDVLQGIAQAITSIAYPVKMIAQTENVRTTVVAVNFGTPPVTAKKRNS